MTTQLTKPTARELVVCQFQCTYEEDEVKKSLARWTFTGCSDVVIKKRDKLEGEKED